MIHRTQRRAMVNQIVQNSPDISSDEDKQSAFVTAIIGAGSRLEKRSGYQSEAVLGYTVSVQIGDMNYTLQLARVYPKNSNEPNELYFIFKNEYQFTLGFFGGVARFTQNSEPVYALKSNLMYNINQRVVGGTVDYRWQYYSHSILNYYINKDENLRKIYDWSDIVTGWHDGFDFEVNKYSNTKNNIINTEVFSMSPNVAHKHYYEDMHAKFAPIMDANSTEQQIIESMYNGALFYGERVYSAVLGVRQSILRGDFDARDWRSSLNAIFKKKWDYYNGKA